MKDDTQVTTWTEKSSPKTLSDQTGPENRLLSQGTIGKSRANRQLSDLKNLEVSRAETATMLKKYYQRAKRRKRILKVAGIFGVVLMVLGGIGTWLWDESHAFKVVFLRVVSSVASIHVEPEMVSIPAGTFRQGDIYDEDNVSEQSLRDVKIKKFAMGRFEVTFEEYDRFAIATSRVLTRDEDWGRDNRPVINVS